MINLIYNSSSEELKALINTISSEFSSLSYTPDKAIKTYFKALQNIPLPRTVSKGKDFDFNTPKMNEFYKGIKD